MIFTNVPSAIGTFTVTTSMGVHVLACNYSRTVIALLYGIAHNICFVLNLGSIFKVILKTPLAEELPVALLTNYFISHALPILCIAKIGILMGICVCLFWCMPSYTRGNSMGYHRKQSKIL